MKVNLIPKIFFLNAALASYLMLATNAPAQTAVKMLDLYADANGGPKNPQCRFTLIGTNLWFTSNAGGRSGVGGVFSYDLYNNTVTQLADFDGVTGNKPWAASVTVANGVAWFTTSLGGAGAKGSLCSMDLTTYAVTNVFSFPNSSGFGTSPHSTPVQIGNDLWFTTSGGGVLPDGVTTGQGTIVKYSLINNTLTNVFTLDTTNSGRQFIGNSLVKAGDAYYYLTFAGGTNIAGGTANGAGIVGKITFTDPDHPVLTKAADLPGRFIALPAGDPVYDGTNFLYFTTVGVSTNPGALVRFNLTNGAVTSLFNFVSNAVAVTNFGKQPYGTPVLYNNELFFTTFGGGTLAKGIFGKLTLSNNVVTKLADLEGTAGLALGGASQYNGGTLYTNPANGIVSMFWPLQTGGAINFGSIVRLNWALPIFPALRDNQDGSVTLSWTGGYGPFNVDAANALGDWHVGWMSGLATNSITVPRTNDAAFFRIQGLSQ